MTRFRAAHLNDIEQVNDGRCPARAVRHDFGIKSFGINAWTAAQPGDRLINEHDEDDGADSQEELYFVHSGRARFELDGESLDAPAGTFVYVSPGVRRTAFAEQPETTLLAMGGTPGKAYQVFGWEVWAPLRPLYEAGDYAGVAKRGREIADRHPEYPGVVYNVACCESLAGCADAAIEHLRIALTQSEQLRDLATTDTDLDPIRDEPEFKALVGTA
jgi:hypothetical protein